MEEIDKFIEDLSELQKYIILLLKSNREEPVKGNTWFQKELFLMAKNIPILNEESSFKPDMFGPFSENAEEQLEGLEMDDVINKVGNKICLSKFGEKIADSIEQKMSKNVLRMISDFKYLLNDLTDEEILTFIYFTFQEYTEESLVLKKIGKNRKSIAIKLYKKEKISLQKASELSGIPLEKFVRELEKQ